MLYCSQSELKSFRFFQSISTPTRVNSSPAGKIFPFFDYNTCDFEHEKLFSSFAEEYVYNEDVQLCSVFETFQVQFNQHAVLYYYLFCHLFFVYHFSKPFVKMSHFSATSLFLLTKNIQNNFKFNFDIVSPTLRYLQHTSTIVLDPRRFVLLVLIISLLIASCKNLRQFLKQKYPITSQHNSRIIKLSSGRLNIVPNNFHSNYSDNNWFSLNKNVWPNLYNTVKFVTNST